DGDSGQRRARQGLRRRVRTGFGLRIHPARGDPGSRGRAHSPSAARGRRTQVARIMTGAPLLRATEVSIRRGGRLLVSEVALELRVGEIVALPGPNGAGKSTLLRGLAGLDAVTRGTITAGGRVTAALQVPALARRSVVANVEAALSWSGSERGARR